MKENLNAQAKVLELPRAKTGKPRKSSVNQNRDGSVRKINNKAYIDFIYLGERVRENSGLA